MSSGFISESEILEARRRRQEEWEKVRTDDQPQEAPEEVYDNRPLFLRLEEQRLKKEAEYEEAHKLKNMIRGLDDDEVGFLDLVEQSKAKAAQMISLEEQKEMREFRERVSNLAESEEINRMRIQLVPARAPLTTKHIQTNKLHGMVVRKRKAGEMDENDKQDKGKTDKGATPAKTSLTPASPVVEDASRRCVGVLPGLGYYDTDSTSDSGEDTSDVEADKFCNRDLLGRVLENEKRKEEANRNS